MDTRSPNSPVSSTSDALDPIRKRRSVLRHNLHDGEKIERSILISRPIEEVYRFWQDFTNLPLFMKHVESIEKLSVSRSRWTYVVAPGLRLTWDAEILAQTSNRVISWETLPGAAISFAGSVWFHPQLTGTEVRVIFIYRFEEDGKWGRIWHRLGARVAALFGADPAQILEEDLRALKALLESPN